MTDQERRVLNGEGADTLMAEIATTIQNEFATQTANLVAEVYAVSGMMYLFHEDNVQAISQYGEEGKTYVFGDSSTDQYQGGVPQNALYYFDPEGAIANSEYDYITFVTTEDGQYIETQPNDQGEMFTCEYHNDITYLG